ncbi:MAG: ABC transporter substrate-binding protein [Deinococcota bacterium]|jgi:iron complex transport system substrate-binding protein|nr:ABC transporter substrate-binding protein [Deinococcota bacterium]
MKTLEKTHDPLRRFLFLLLTLVSTVALAGYPLTVSDDLGREVTLEAEPERIVSMLPSHTEVVCAVGACDKLVGVDDYSDFPLEVTSLPRLGGGLTGADVEAIIALEPDLVLASQYGELAETLAGAGLTVYAGSSQSYEEALAEFELLGRMVGREEEGALLAERVRSEVEEVAALTASQEAPRVYYEIDPTPYSVGPGSFMGVLIAKAGGDNIVGEEMGDFPQLDPEFVVASDPEVIVVGEFSAGELPQRPGWEAVTAVGEGRVVALSLEESTLVSRPGPRMAEAVRLFARLFHPELF